MDTIGPEVSLPFGKELAANEKKTRDKAVRSLKKFIATGADLSKSDLLKLWKGLFYCYWMSDKPLVQQALAQDLGSLLLDLSTDSFIPFLEAFWEIHCTQWHGIDRIRLDKYYMLLRRMIFFAFLYLANQDWNEEMTEAYMTMLLEGPMHPTDRSKPDSIRYHIIDIYFEELDKILELQREQGEEIHLDMDAIKRPLVVSSKDAINKVTRKKAKEALAARKQQEKEDEDEEKEEDENVEDASEEPEQVQVEEEKIASEESEPEQDVEEEVKPKKSSSSSKKRKASTKKQSKKRKL
ncbi:hypothetical protein O0I10_011596 [Lichtheimia ornata]|uniref:Nop52-domain-containing protein n=1 Tax=Lichtheimia ornata TaxID=688661 RepID=A0AAD7XSI7_9FUNG|nr:uncharacterized protein O0I10_011596 [Lichtheimia ornata]KAJ8652790.1 hypothetical protein O0I10_011596 [Lichtheimia ornata]